MTGLDDLNPDQLRELLLATAGDRADPRFFVEPRLHPAVELQRHYDASDYLQKARLKTALTEAVAEWRQRAHGAGNLRFLAQASAAIRARSTAPHFERILRLHRLLNRPADAPNDGVVGDVLATLAGFAQGDEIGELLERLFLSPGLLPGLAGVLFQGLCRCRPAELPRWLERYVEVVDGSGIRHFSQPIFLRLFVESVTPPALVNAWPDLDSKLRQFLLEDLGRLRRRESPELFFALEAGGATLHVVVGDREETFELRSRSVGQRWDDMRKAYDLIDLPPAVH
ncbi:MAG: hypothetical protein AAFX50_01410 [Acidobacteriota bacterium]